MPEFNRKIVMNENDDGTITIEAHMAENEEPIMALVPLSFEGLLYSLSEDAMSELHEVAEGNMIIITDPDEEFN